jgi:hypothetical protein
VRQRTVTKAVLSNITKKRKNNKASSADEDVRRKQKAKQHPKNEKFIFPRCSWEWENGNITTVPFVTFLSQVPVQVFEKCKLNFFNRNWRQSILFYISSTHNERPFLTVRVDVSTCGSVQIINVNEYIPELHVQCLKLIEIQQICIGYFEATRGLNTYPRGTSK